MAAVLVLLRSRADSSKRVLGKTALDCAREDGNREVVAILEKREAKTGTVPKEFTLELFGRNPPGLRRKLLNSAVFADLPLLAVKDVPQDPLRLQPETKDRLSAEITFLLSTVSQLYRKERKTLEAEFGPLPDTPRITLDVIDKGSAGAFMDADGTLKLDVKLLRANLAASIISSFPELSERSDSERVVFLEELRRQIRMTAGVITTNIEPDRLGGFKSMGSLGESPKVGDYSKLLDRAEQAMPADVQYFGTLLFVVAHEIGHAALGHFSKAPGCEDRELQADHFAALLLGESFLALSAKVIAVQAPASLAAGSIRGDVVSGNAPVYGLWYLDREALRRYSAFSVFLDKGYEFSRFTASGSCYPKLDRRLAATRAVLDEIVKNHGTAVIERLQKQKDREAILHEGLRRLGMLGIIQ